MHIIIRIYSVPCSSILNLICSYESNLIYMLLNFLFTSERNGLPSHYSTFAHWYIRSTYCLIAIWLVSFAESVNNINETVQYYLWILVFIGWFELVSRGKDTLYFLRSLRFHSRVPRSHFVISPFRI